MDLYYIAVPFCSIGVLSNIAIIVTILRSSGISDTYEYKFILIFSCFDLITTSSTVIPSLLFKDNRTMCTIQGVLLQFSNFSGILWLGLISIAIFREFILFKPRFDKGFIKPLIVITFFSAFTALLPLYYDAYTLSGNWCWFENPEGENKARDYLFRFLFCYVFVWSVIALNFVLTILVRRQMINETIFDFRGNQLVNRLKWYPWILCLCYTPMTIMRILDGIQVIPTWFSAFAGILIRLMAFFNAIAFFTSDKIKTEVLNRDPKPLKKKYLKMTKLLSEDEVNKPFS